MSFYFIFLLCFINRINLTVQQLRVKRFPEYAPDNTGNALGMALEIPLEGMDGNVAVSICTESNFNQPTYDGTDGDPPPFTTFYEAVDGSRALTKKRPSRNGIFTRKNIYRMIEEKLKIFGFNGEVCLLKAICQTSQHDLGWINGVLGDIFHIVFTPTASRNENIHQKYYDAEQNGLQKKCEEKYGEKCPKGIFELITVFG